MAGGVVNAGLHRRLRTLVTIDSLFALAEISFLHAEDSEQRQYYLAAAHAFLPAEREEVGVQPIDPRFRRAGEAHPPWAT